MSIDIPRIVPVQTPQGVTTDERVRVHHMPREQPIPADLGRHAIERRLLPERRNPRDRRPLLLDIRSGHERREDQAVDIDV